jgi:NAD-dependent deacetylase
MLDKSYSMALYYLSKCDTLIVAGTSLTVEPASSLVGLFQGKNLVIINNDETFYDKEATLVIHDDLEKVFKNLK